MEGARFYCSDVAERLAVARLAEQDEADQYEVGFHIARRALRVALAV